MGNKAGPEPLALGLSVCEMGATVFIPTSGRGAVSGWSSVGLSSGELVEKKTDLRHCGSARGRGLVRKGQAGRAAAADNSGAERGQGRCASPAEPAASAPLTAPAAMATAPNAAAPAGRWDHALLLAALPLKDIRCAGRASSPPPLSGTSHVLIWEGEFRVLRACRCCYGDVKPFSWRWVTGSSPLDPQ